MQLVRVKDQKALLKAYYTLLCEEKMEAEQKPELYEVWEKAIETSFIEQTPFSTELFLFQKGEDFIGCVELRLEEECTPVDDLPYTCACITNFYICKGVRRQKLGTTFFALLRQWAREKGAAFIEVVLKKEKNPAEIFLQSQGMDLVGKGLERCYRLIV